MLAPSSAKRSPRDAVCSPLVNPVRRSAGEDSKRASLFRSMSVDCTGSSGEMEKRDCCETLFDLFADRVFDLFDLKRNGVIEFGEFVRSLSIFHPKASESEKTKCTYSLSHLRGTGYIEREELREMVVALLDESDVCLSDGAVEEIVDNMFNQADFNGDGRIDPKEWEEFVKKNPASLRNMSLPYLEDITTAFPSFVMHSEAEDCGGIDK
ncbi:unnamed protein product [Alopecurus aequalis]